jgi:hypothetical protein
LMCFFRDKESCRCLCAFFVRSHNRWRGLFQGIGDAIITVTQAGDDRYNSGSKQLH